VSPLYISFDIDASTNRGKRIMTSIRRASILLFGLAVPSFAQDHHGAAAMAAIPASSGQAAFAAMSEIVSMLEADPNTRWDKVNIEALRQHLIDMDDVTMRSVVAQRNVPGGFEADITGSGRTADAIRRIARNHTAMLDAGVAYRASETDIPDGARITITTRTPADSTAVARVRGLGVAGMLTEGAHHAAHHLALARGERVHER
jgi:hypothetical protein